MTLLTLLLTLDGFSEDGIVNPLGTVGWRADGDGASVITLLNSEYTLSAAPEELEIADRSEETTAGLVRVG